MPVRDDSKKKGGRPSKLTPGVQDAVCEALRQGSYREPAARAAGIGTSTFHRWMDRGEADDEGYAKRLAEIRVEDLPAGSPEDAVPDDDSDYDEDPRLAEFDTPYRRFRLAIIAAEGEGEREAVDLIRQSARGGTWQAAAWLLERKYPDRWSRRERVDLTAAAQVSASVDAEVTYSRPVEATVPEERRLEVARILAEAFEAPRSN